jgi:transcriptional regulator with PAS, ATPase and Fis domain
MSISTFIHSTKLPAFILDHSHNVVETNQAVLKILDKLDKEVGGKKCYELFHKTSYPPEGCPMERMLKSGCLETEEMFMETFNGNFFVSCTPIHNDEGNFTHAIHIMQKSQLERRRFKRLNARFHSVILSKGNSYAGSIENVSEEGLAYIMSTFNEAKKDLIPEEKIKLLILTPSGYTLNLNCEIIWTKEHCEKENFCIGAKIIDSSAKYKEFLETLE